MKKLAFVAVALLYLTVLSPQGSIAQESGTKLKYGFNERVRNTYFNNIMDWNEDADDKNHFFRIRSSLWAQYSFAPKALIYAKLTNENRPYIHPDKDYEFNEIFFDNLYAKISFGSSIPTTLTIGRQNIIYGEGFIMLEGGPWDGSRAIYHDAVKLSMQKGKTTIDLLGINNTASEEHLPVFNEVDPENPQKLNDSDEVAFGTYITNTSKPNLKLEGYFFNKTEKFDTELKTNTIGGRATKSGMGNLSLVTEWAYQFGSHGDTDISGFGGYGYLSYLACKKRNTILKAGANYLSGDDPETTDKNEGWNPIFSKWPKWSELYIYSQIPEKGKVAYWTNTFSPWVSVNLNLCKKVNFSATFYHLKAIHSLPPAEGKPFGTGKTRGNEIQLLFKIKFNKLLTGHFLYDYFSPGDYYKEDRVSGQFIRGELMFNISN